MSEHHDTTGAPAPLNLAARVEALEKQLAGMGELLAGVQRNAQGGTRVPAPFRVIDPESGECMFEVHTNEGEGPTFCLTDRAGWLLVDGGQEVDGRGYLRVHQRGAGGAAVELHAEGLHVHR